MSVVQIDRAYHRMRQDGAVVIEFRAGLIPMRRRGRLITTSEPDRRVGSLVVEFSRRGGERNVKSVVLSGAEGLTPSELQRFAWGRWLSVADAVARSPRRLRGDLWRDAHLMSRNYRALMAEKGFKVKAHAKRPGRRGHPQEHFRRIAERYMQLRLAGERAPVKRIAAELGFSRNTVAGWVRRARELGFLKEARPSRPG